MLATLEPRPRALWPLALLAALEGQGSGDAFGVLELHHAGGITRISDVEFTDDVLGLILGRIVSWPRLPLGWYPGTFRLGLPLYHVDAEDPDSTLEGILEGAAARSVFRARVTIRAAHPSIPSSSWPIHWTGILARWSSPRTGVVRLELAHDHGWLNAPLLRHRVNAAEFRNAHESAFERRSSGRVGRALAIATGTLDSRAAPIEVPGAVPTLYLDTRDDEWLFVPILGAAQQVTRVWAGGTLDDDDALRYFASPILLASNAYTVTLETIAGYDLTCVRLLADPADFAAGKTRTVPVVRCDLVGHETEGDGTGHAIQSPLLQLRHRLLLAWSSWRSGPWPDPTQGPLDLESWAAAETYLAGNLRRPWDRGNTWTQGRRGARLVTDGELTARSELNLACAQLGLRPYWSEAGKIALAVIDHRRRRVYLDADHHVRDEDLVDELGTHPGRQRLRERLESGPLTVRDASTPWGSSEALRAAAAGSEISEADLVPYVTTQDSGFTTAGAGDPHLEVDDPPFAPDDDVTRATWDAASVTGTFRTRARLSPAPQIPQALEVIAVGVRWRGRYVPNGGGDHLAKAGVYIAATPYYGPAGDRVLTTDWTDYEEPFPVNPATSLPWTLEDLGPDALELIFSATHTASQDEVEVTQLSLRVYLADGGAQAGLVRERLSAELLLSRPVKTLDAVVGLHRAGIAPGSYFSVSSQTPAAVGGQGWGTETWQRRLHVLCCRVIEWGQRRARLVALDARDLLVPWWETGKASTSAPLAGDVVRLGAWLAGRAGGADGRRFSRITEDDGSPTGVDTITGPNGETVAIDADHERYTDQGLELLTAAGGVSGDRLQVLSCHDAQAWDVEGGGSAVFLVDLPALGAAELTVVRCGSDRLYFTVSADDALRFRRVVGSSTSTASIDLGDAGIVAGLVAIAIRWTPGTGGLERLSEDELLEPVPPYTLDLWARQAGVTTRAAAVVALAGFNGHLEVLQDAGASHFGGAFRWGRTWRQLLTDEELEAELGALT